MYICMYVRKVIQHTPEYYLIAVVCKVVQALGCYFYCTTIDSCRGLRHWYTYILDSAYVRRHGGA